MVGRINVGLLLVSWVFLQQLCSRAPVVLASPLPRLHHATAMKGENHSSALRRAQGGEGWFIYNRDPSAFDEDTTEKEDTTATTTTSGNENSENDGVFFEQSDAWTDPWLRKKSVKCDSSKKSCAPSSAPSISNMPSAEPSSQPSMVPTISHAPTISPAPTPAPTISFMPSKAPTSQPSAEPTQLPSVPPTISPAPSKGPTSQPSAEPTQLPSVPPTISPAPTTTKKPTDSPTPDPFGTETTIITNPNGETGVVTNCRASIPSAATAVQDQNVIFDYALNVRQGADEDLSIDLIATRLHSELSETFLDCRFDDDKDFYVHALTSLPKDLVLEQGCSEEQTAEGADCYLVSAAFVSHIFYQQNNGRARQLQSSEGVGESITDPNVSNAFSTAIQEIFDSGKLFQGFSDIVGADFVEIVNDDTATELPTADNGATAAEKGLSPGAKAGTSIGVLLGVFIIAALIIFAIARGRKEQTKALNETAESAFFREALNEPAESAFFREDEEESIGSEEGDDKAMIADKSILSDDVSYLHDSRQKSYVINDEQSMDETLDPETMIESFEVREGSPTFQRVDTQLRRGTYREYGIPDTVDI